MDIKLTFFSHLPTRLNGHLPLFSQGLKIAKGMPILGRWQHIHRQEAGNFMKISAISPHCSASVEQVLEAVSLAPGQLIVLPGVAGNTPPPEAVQERLKPGAWAYVESWAGSRSAGKPKGPSKRATPDKRGTGEGWDAPRALLVSAAEQIELPAQWFTSRPLQGDLQALQDSLAARTHVIGGREVTFLLCGEINGIDLNGCLRYGQPLQCPVLINPAHTTMGRWHLLNQKFAALSRQGVVVHVANNDRASLAATTGLRIYHHGKRIELDSCHELIRSCTYEV
ncbi:hypothetical protein [Pseudomonas sp. NPDC089406]|uniref:hypothetical protein n=1 Tax=Pseudomonas sp. NPDC089406 TaxID=3364463 RepID=UPI00384E6448